VTDLPAARGVPEVGRAAWDKQYSDGRWTYLGEAEEVTRYSAIANRICSVKARRVLDLGCGEGLLIRQLDTAGFTGRYIGVEWSFAALQRCRARPDRAFVCGDVTRIPIAGTFDVVVLSEVLYYLSDPWLALRRALELVAPAGQLFISLYRPSPNYRPGWQRHIMELEDQLPRRAGNSVVLELIVAEDGGRCWALYALSQA
jgi:SAM-dependent methyltransferase